MRNFTMLFAALAGLSVVTLTPVSAEAGCIRMGETGYHWYRYCVGPRFLYPHRRVCRHGHCWLR